MRRLTTLSISALIVLTFEYSQAAKIVESDKTIVTLTPTKPAENFSVGQVVAVIVDDAQNGFVRIIGVEQNKYKAQVIRGVAPVGAEALSKEDATKRTKTPSTGREKTATRVSAWMDMMPTVDAEETISQNKSEKKSNHELSIVVQSIDADLNLKQVIVYVGEKVWKTESFAKTPDGYQINGVPSAACNSKIKIELKLTNKKTNMSTEQVFPTQVECVS